MLIDASQLISATWIDSVEHHAELGSTQDRARAAAEELPLGRSLLVIADRQTTGRGRGANRWWTGEGSLAFSLLYDPAEFELARSPVPQVSLAAGVALVDTLAPLVGDHPVGLHWPNDVYAADRKLAGILVEVLPDGRHILGVGANTNNVLADAPDELRELIVTLHWLAGRLVDHGELLKTFLERFAVTLRMLAQAPLQLGARFDELCLQHGQTLTIRNGAERTTGRCAGIAADGALLLDTERGRRAFYSGTLR
jgi:BirA family transcriptional regulator, biotin operon repressor / biotin---[acetyl-CoA-carboxylase] ligase